jgi:hypothetical protein
MAINPRFSVTLTPPAVAWLTAEAARIGITVPDLIRRLVDGVRLGATGGAVGTASGRSRGDVAGDGSEALAGPRTATDGATARNFRGVSENGG